MVGEATTAAMLNAHFRDNMNASEAAIATITGDLIYATGANALARLAIGATRKFLQGGAAAPSWQYINNVPISPAVMRILRATGVSVAADAHTTLIASGVSEGAFVQGTITDITTGIYGGFRTYVNASNSPTIFSNAGNNFQLVLSGTSVYGARTVGNTGTDSFTMVMLAVYR